MPAGRCVSRDAPAGTKARPAGDSAAPRLPDIARWIEKFDPATWYRQQAARADDDTLHEWRDDACFWLALADAGALEWLGGGRQVASWQLEAVERELDRRVQLNVAKRRTSYGQPAELIAAIRERTDLWELVGIDGLKLHAAGRDYTRGHCPFHHDSDPSFAVWHDHYHCFGCLEHGDCFDWLRAMRGLSFKQALEELAQATGVPVVRPRPAGQLRTRMVPRG